MGAKQTTAGHEKKTKEPEPGPGDEVNFNHFQALRSIGRGSFGKVCIVQKKDTKRLYAMKYTSKLKCIHDGAVSNVLQEQQLLRNLEHPYIVNLRYAFQDVEDIFMVEDLLLGGDLRYHLQQTGKLGERDVLLYVSELALALDYLKSRHIIHRDVKPDNILLDEEGRAHLTDFNVATSLGDGRLAMSQCGTQPYIAPEVFECAVGERAGYSYPADWWSLGVTACELLKGKRPFEVPNSPTMAWDMFKTGEIHFSSNMSDDVKAVLSRLICVDPGARLCSASSLATYVSYLDMDAILHKRLKHTFLPSTKQLNVDPTYELEELIIESKPIHKKKQRLAKVADVAHAPEQDEHVLEQLQQLEAKFLPYNWESALTPGDAASSLDQVTMSNTEEIHGRAARDTPKIEQRSSPKQTSSRSVSPSKVVHKDASLVSVKKCAAASACDTNVAGQAKRHSSGAEALCSAPDHVVDADEHGAAADDIATKQPADEHRRTSAIVQELCTSAVICTAAMIADYEPPLLQQQAGSAREVMHDDQTTEVVCCCADATTVTSEQRLVEPLSPDPGGVAVDCSVVSNSNDRVLLSDLCECTSATCQDAARCVNSDKLLECQLSTHRNGDSSIAFRNSTSSREHQATALSTMTNDRHDVGCVLDGNGCWTAGRHGSREGCMRDLSCASKAASNLPVSRGAILACSPCSSELRGCSVCLDTPSCAHAYSAGNLTDHACCGKHDSASFRYHDVAMPLHVDLPATPAAEIQST